MLTGAGLGSVKTLLSLQSDVAVSASVRRRAARDILDLGIKFREIDELEQRLAAVEGRLEGTVHDTPENQGESAFARTPEEDLVDGAAEAVRDDTESDGLGTPA
jgi:hypothetical protein